MDYFVTFSHIWAISFIFFLFDNYKKTIFFHFVYLKDMDYFCNLFSYMGHFQHFFYLTTTKTKYANQQKKHIPWFDTSPITS